MVGKRILNYIIEQKLGEGGMGAVYIASHAQLERKAAIKALHSNFVNNPEIRERFRNEASTLARLNHPNIVDLYDYVEEQDGLFLIMEYVRGREVDDYIQNVSGPIPQTRLVQIFSQVLDGFAYAHKQGIVHRDIKPSNLIITPELDMRILDFGIAKIIDGNRKNMTQVGTRMGTVLYMSPEQVRGEALDYRSDIYSLGVTLFQMVTGRSVYDEYTATEYDIYSKILNQPLPRAKDIYPAVSNDMQLIIDKSTAKSPYNRFQSCEEFKEALLKLNGFVNSTNNTASRQINTSNTGYSSNSNQNQYETPKRSNAWILWTSLVLLFFAVGAIVLFNPFKWDFLKEVAVLSEEESNEPTEDDILIAKSTLTNYYNALNKRDYPTIRSFYADTIEYYFSYENISANRDLKASLKYGWEKNPVEMHKFLPESVFVEKDSLKGNHIVTFEYQYTYQRPEEEKKTLNKQGEIKFNENWKICSVRNIR